MKFLVTYDLPSSKAGSRRRARIARILEGYGFRVQLSVFELDIPPTSLPHIAQEIEAIVHPEEDSLRIYPLCRSCCEKHMVLGQSSYLEHQDVYVF